MNFDHSKHNAIDLLENNRDLFRLTTRGCLSQTVASRAPLTSNVEYHQIDVWHPRLLNYGHGGTKFVAYKHPRKYMFLCGQGEVCYPLLEHNIEKKGHPVFAAKSAEGRKPRIYVAGPLGNDPRVQERNFLNAVDFGEAVAMAGGRAFVPHLALRWDRIHSKQYESWMEYDFDWLDVCDAVVVMPGDSPGARREAARALAHNKPVFFVSDKYKIDSMESIHMAVSTAEQSISVSPSVRHFSMWLTQWLHEDAALTGYTEVKTKVLSFRSATQSEDVDAKMFHSIIPKTVLVTASVWPTPGSETYTPCYWIGQNTHKAFIDGEMIDEILAEAQKAIDP